MYRECCWLRTLCWPKGTINIERQVLDTRGEIGYAIYDINRGCDEELIGELGKIPHTIRVRTAAGRFPTD